MTGRPARVISIHDLSAFGRCSLSVILPVLSAMGVQPVPVVTAVLSTHTGGFGQVATQELGGFLQPCLDHFQQIGLEAECVYSGYLADKSQIDSVLRYIDAYSRSLIVVDPVMGDNGRLYSAFSADVCVTMRRLVARANLITPNLTEACFLLGQPFTGQAVDRITARSLLVRLSELGPGLVVVTSVPMADGKISNVAYDRQSNSFWRTECDYMPVHYPGTGDIFASTLVGGLLTGDSLPLAMDRATRFVELCIRTTFGYATPAREGVMLERVLPFLTQTNVFNGYHTL